MKYLSALTFVGTVFAANWAINKWGPVPVGFGLMAPAGVYLVGLAFLLRDTTQRLGGKRWVLVAILVGAGCSYFVNARFALASAVAFLVSELADFAVYTPLEERRFLTAVVASNTVGLLLDSFIFLSLAFGSLAFFWGQVVGKAWVTALALPFLFITRRRLQPGKP